MATLEDLVRGCLTRKFKQPPVESQRLRVFFDILFDLEADHHRRTTGKSVFYNDLQAFMSMVNGDVTSDRLEHYCWSEGGRPCCQNMEACQEKTTVAALNLLTGAGSISCESRWTNLLPSMKRTLTRMVVKALRPSNFDAAAEARQADSPLDGDDAAKAEYFQALNSARAQRANAYFADDKNKFELGVLVVVLEVSDKLLYAMLGGADRSQAPCKLSALVNRRTTMVGAALAGALQLLEGWSEGDMLRRPWSILELLGAPLQDVAYAQWSRSQILRMATSLSPLRDQVRRMAIPIVQVVRRPVVAR